MFCNDIIGPLVKRVLRKLGIREEIQSSVFVPQVEVEIPANTASNRVKVEGLGEASWVVGEQYRVIWDGVPYDLVLKEVSSTSSWLYLGNGKPYGKEDTGEPFCVSVSASYTYGMVADFADNSVTRTHTLKVEQVTETITPIDQKYLPGVCLPVVEIAYIEALSEAEQAKLTACIGMPIILKTEFFTLVANYLYINVHSFVGVFSAETVFNIVSEDGVTWTAQGL